MIDALWSNPNYDPDKEDAPNIRQEAIANITEQCERTVYFIRNGKQMPGLEEEEIDTANNPFYAAMARGQKKLEGFETSVAPVSEVIDYSKTIDQ